MAQLFFVSLIVIVFLLISLMATALPASTVGTPAPASSGGKAGQKQALSPSKLKASRITAIVTAMVLYALYVVIDSHAAGLEEGQAGGLKMLLIGCAGLAAGIVLSGLLYVLRQTRYQSIVIFVLALSSLLLIYYYFAPSLGDSASLQREIAVFLVGELAGMMLAILFFNDILTVIGVTWDCQCGATNFGLSMECVCGVWRCRRCGVQNSREQTQCGNCNRPKPSDWESFSKPGKQ